MTAEERFWYFVWYYIIVPYYKTAVATKIYGQLKILQNFLTVKNVIEQSFLLLKSSLKWYCMNVENMLSQYDRFILRYHFSSESKILHKYLCKMQAEKKTLK